MRTCIFMFIAVLMGGCATVQHKDPETGLEVTYTGGVHGAVEVVRATDGRPYDLAETAMDKGMATSLARDTDGDVRFSAGYGYAPGVPGTSPGGYAAPTTGYVPGYGWVSTGQTGGLPPLVGPTTTGQSPVTTGQGLVPCPRGRPPANVAEQAACAADGIEALSDLAVPTK